MSEIQATEAGSVDSGALANTVSENFDSGASYLMSEYDYKKWICEEGTGLVGRPDGQFVAPANEMDE